MSKAYGNRPDFLMNLPFKVGGPMVIKAGTPMFNTVDGEWFRFEEDITVTAECIYGAQEMEVGLSAWNGEVIFRVFTKEMWKELREVFGEDTTLADLWEYMVVREPRVFVVLQEMFVRFKDPRGVDHDVTLPDLLELS